MNDCVRAQTKKQIPDEVRIRSRCVYSIQLNRLLRAIGVAWVHGGFHSRLRT